MFAYPVCCIQILCMRHLIYEEFQVLLQLTQQELPPKVRMLLAHAGCP